jgi:transposase InsO family protein
MKAIADPTPGKYRLWQTDKPLLNKYDRWRKQGEALKLSKRARIKLEWFIYYYSRSNQKALLTCRYFGISKSVFYKWLAVFDPLNLRALEEGSRSPVKTRTTELTPAEEQNILALRKQHPEYGKMKIRRLYFTQYKTWISSWKVQLVIEKYHLQRRPDRLNRQFKKQSVSKRKTVELQKRQTPGFLVAFDSIILYRNDLKRYIVTGIDTVSKVAWARMYKNHSSATTKDLFIRLYAITQGNILNTCQDNGSEFEKDFARLLDSMKIPQYFSRVKTPKDNPVCERFNRTLKEEFLRQGNYTSDIQEFNRRLSLWLIKYNTFRPHQSLKYQTPFEYHFNHLPANPLVHDVVI